MVQGRKGTGASPARGRTRGRPTPDMVAQIDREILDAARELFFAHGYARTSMAMIVRAAGVSKTTLYARYADKMDLFRATLALAVEQIGYAALNSSTYAHFGVAEGLQRFGTTALANGFAPLWSRYERLAFAEGPHFPEMADAVATQVRLAIHEVVGYLEHCMARDGLTFADPEALATSYMMALRGYYTVALLAAREPPVEERKAFMRQLVGALLPGPSAQGA
jgi:AcrR family transcriptional regulator